MEATKTFQVTDENGYISYAQDDDFYSREKEEILNAFCELETSAELGSFNMDDARVMRNLLKNYVALLNAVHSMVEIETC